MNAEHNGRDYDVLNDICNVRDKDLILRIPLSISQKEDSWLWLLDKQGTFTWRSYYRFLHGEYHSDHASFWNQLWFLRIPGKVLNFL